MASSWLSQDTSTYISDPRLKGWGRSYTRAMPARRSLPDHVALADSDRRQVDEILASLRSVLGEDLVGAYLHGSAALGRLRQQSDIDVLAVAARTMTDHQGSDRSIGSSVYPRGTRLPRRSVRSS